MSVELPKETLEYFENDELRARVFYEKFALRTRENEVVEKTAPEMWERVSKEIASVEKDKEKYQKEFYWLLEDFKFVPGGRILFAAGSHVKASLLNCYYIPIKADSIEAIFDTAKEIARTYSYGGGVGIDISILRPRGAKVNNSAIRTSGAVSFMDLYSLTTGLIGQSGRRGALMITMDVRHPEIENFVTVKSDKTKVTHANISVMIDDEFMNAVREDKDFELYFKNDKAEVKNVIRATALWNKIVDTALNTGDPGIIFWDKVKNGSPTEYDDKMAVKGVNPCAEQPLEDYGACDLGNLNLAAYVLDPFTDKAQLDWQTLERAVRLAVRFLDNVLDYGYSRHPLKAQAEESLYSRRIGLGVLGLGTMFIKLGVKYDTDEAIKVADELFRRIKETAYDEDTNLAAEKAVFPAFRAEKHLDRPFVKHLPASIKEKIKKKGLRNCCILTIPPTGDTSSMTGVSSGAEPIYALSFIRRSESLSQEYFEVFEPVVKTYMKKFNIKDIKELPSYFVVAHKIDPFFRVKMQATIQQHIDSSISSTVNLAKEVTADTVNKIYFYAWELGCKSITVYREGSKRDILKATDEGKESREESMTEEERPYMMSGTTIKLPTAQGNNLYVTINKNDNDEIKEIFISMGRSGEMEKSYTEAIGRLISVYLQSGGNAARVVKTLRGIKGGNSTWFNGMQLLSVPDAIAKSIELVMKKRDLNAPNATLHSTIEGGASIKSNTCPSCRQHTLVFENGCYSCKSCGYTKCE